MAVESVSREDSAQDVSTARLRAERWGLPYRDADAISIDPAARDIISRDESRRLRVLPLEIRDEGPVFAVVEPSEEIFATLRELAGHDASFVVVSQQTLDVLVSEAFGLGGSGRRLSRFRGRGRDEASVGRDPDRDGDGMDAGFGEDYAAPHERPRPARTDAASLSTDAASLSTDAVERLLHQITAGTANLTTEVAVLTESLEETRRELQAAREELEEARTAHASHDEVVDTLRAEVGELRAALEESQSLNATIALRLQDVVETLEHPAQTS